MKIYLFEWHNYREGGAEVDRQTQRDLLSSGLFPKCPEELSLGQAKPLSLCGYRDPGTWAIF